MGTITGGAALALLGLERHAIADTYPGGDMVTDYVGRLCYNENPLGPSPAAMQAIQDEAEMAHRYPDWYAESLTAMLSDKYDLSPTKFICGVGATEILRFCAQAFCRPGTNVVVPYPSYGQFDSDAQIFGSNVRHVDLDNDYRVDLQAMLNRVDSNTAAVCITNPNNPTGTMVDHSDLVDFVNQLPSGTVTIIDEAYIDYVAGYESAIEILRSGADVVVVKTFSKVYGLAGARIGYAVGPQERIGAMGARRMFAMISRPSLEAAKAALDDSEHIANTVDLANQTKAYCFEAFDGMDLPFIPSVASFFMVDVQDGDAVRVALADHGFYVRTGWGMPRHIRVSTGTAQEMVDFIDALEEILSPLRIGGELPRPTTTQLYQAYPNPFNSSTRIKIYVPSFTRVRLDIFDIRGSLVKTLVDRTLSPGEYSYRWNGESGAGAAVASGSYFYRLLCGDDVITKRMILLK